MDEETKTLNVKTIKLTKEEYEALCRLLQWSEDLEQYDQENKPTNMASYIGNLITL